MAFPETHRSVVLAVRSSDQQERARALEAVVAAYWRPVFRHVRARFRVPDEEAGEGVTLVSLETENADGETRELPLADGSDLEADFQREWARSLFALAVAALRQRCLGTSREVAFALFERYDLEDHDASQRPRYADLAAELGLPVTQVTNHLHWARHELRKTVLEKLREITASEEEYRAEARALLGSEPA